MKNIKRITTLLLVVFFSFAVLVQADVVNADEDINENSNDNINEIVGRGINLLNKNLSTDGKNSQGDVITGSMIFDFKDNDFIEKIESTPYTSTSEIFTGVEELYSDYSSSLSTNIDGSYSNAYLSAKVNAKFSISKSMSYQEAKNQSFIIQK